MASSTPRVIENIAAYHSYMELPKPQHPLISVVRFEDIKKQPQTSTCSIMHHFYSVALKKNFTAKMKYGHQPFDFDEGVMHFMAPKQVLTIEPQSADAFAPTGWLLLVHPDFLWRTPLARKIKSFEYFGYHVTEALHLSHKEEQLVTDIIENIAQEYHSPIDSFSQDLMIAHIELLLTYCNRFYQRQFVTRKIVNHGILEKLEVLLSEYFREDDLASRGIPTVQYIAGRLHLSPNYLSRLLQLQTGQSTQQFIHDKLVDAAKEKLSTTSLSISEIAYQLGFEHPQSFSKLFKNKANISPGEFRQEFGR